MFDDGFSNTGGSDDVSSTNPSKNAYITSRNALVIFEANTWGIGDCLDAFDDGAGRSAPAAILYATVVICRWKSSNCKRYRVDEGSLRVATQVSRL
jgi:hypothetical protein